jgi:hemin uptake protein HemP
MTGETDPADCGTAPQSGVDTTATVAGVRCALTASPVESHGTAARTAHDVTISHNGEIYRLQETRLGKLILTK